MRCTARGTLAIILGLLALGSCSNQAATEITFAPSLEEALKLAGERNQPIVADFWRDG